ncbi:MAG: metallophosphoesterase family protein [Anaerolineae bacterium]|nr:metallophosphoesterase family protein [Anaerolineae bacterium]
MNETLRLGVISDTHNHIQNVERAIACFEAEGIRTVLHAGDVNGKAVLRLLAPFELWVAWGNVDRDEKLPVSVAAEEFANAHLAYIHLLAFEEGIRPELLRNPNARKLALLHGDNVPQLSHVIDSGEYDYVIHGHTHQLRDELVGHTRVINPGALGGSGLRPKTFAILDLATGDLQTLEV